MSKILKRIANRITVYNNKTYTSTKVYTEKIDGKKRKLVGIYIGGQRVAVLSGKSISAYPMFDILDHISTFNNGYVDGVVYYREEEGVIGFREDKLLEVVQAMADNVSGSNRRVF